MSRLVLVHGFTQTGASWASLAPHLGGHELVTPDVEIGADLPATAQALGAANGRATYVGYSMGGRLALHLALVRPELVEGLVLVSATAGIDDPDDRAARRRADERLADDIEGDGVDAFIESWLSQPMFAGLPPSASEGRCRDVAVLTASLRNCGTGMQAPLWDRLHEIEPPVLVVAGSRDGKFVALARRLADGLPHGELAIIEGAGHAAHLERPDAVAAAVARWLSH